MKALVGAFNQEKALVGAFSVIVKTRLGTDGALHSTSYNTADIGQHVPDMMYFSLTNYWVPHTF